MDQFTYAPLPPSRFRRITPAAWPQDNLVVPEGYGLMPRVNALNQAIVQREFFCYNAEFTGLQAGNVQSLVIPTQADGDFWLDNIAINTIDATPAEAVMLDGHFQILDINQGYNLMPAFSPTDGAPLGLFQVLPPSVSLAAGPRTVGAGQRTSIIQPYCFMRAGGIQITVSVETWAAVGTFSLFFNLSGWKEYRNAAA